MYTFLLPPFMIYDHHIGALQQNNRIWTTQHIMSLQIIVNNGKEQTTTKLKKYVKINDNMSVICWYYTRDSSVGCC